MRFNHFCIAAVFLLPLLAGLVSANTPPSLLWNTTWGGTYSDRGWGVAVDSDYNVIATGDTWSFGAGNGDAFVAKYNSTGSQLWNVTWGGAQTDDGDGVAVDSDGNILVSGEAYSFGAGNGDAFVAKYNSTGSQLWNVTWGGANNDYGRGIAVDSGGKILVTGRTDSFGTVAYDAFVAEYDSSGSLLWNATWGGSSYDEGFGAAFDSDGNAIVSGWTDSFGAGNDDAFVAKYNSTGSQLWNATWGGTGNDYSDGVAVDSGGNIIIAGHTVSFGTAGSSDAFVAKFNSTGSQLWNATWGGTNTEYGTGVAVDSGGNVTVAGRTDSFGAGNDDAFVLRYDSAGTRLWNVTWGGGDVDEADGVAVDSGGNAIIIGQTSSFGAGGIDVFVAKYGKPVISACGSVATDSVLSGDVVASGTANCLSVTGNNTEIDCGGNWINSTGAGIYIPPSVLGVSVNNCKINSTLSYHTAAGTIDFGAGSYNGGISSNIYTADGVVAVNTAANPSLNRSAKVTMTFSSGTCTFVNIYYLGAYSTNLSEIVASGQLCTASSSPACSIVSCNGNHVVFSVQHFDSYGVEGYAIPEFSPLTAAVALLLAAAGCAAARKRA